MSIKAFLYLPEDDNSILEFCDSYDNCLNIVRELKIIKEYIRKSNGTLLFSPDNVRNFIEKSSTINTGIYLSNIEKTLLRTLSNNSLEVRYQYDQNFYYKWDSTGAEICSCNDLLNEACKAYKTFIDDSVIVLTFYNHLNEKNEQINIIKDCPYNGHLPELIKLAYSISDIDFISWYNSINERGFSLYDTENFEPTSFRWKKQRIYREKVTGHFWYFDYFHKDNKIHYEVFSANGKKHIGEANQDGNIIEGTSSIEKKIDDILR